MMNKTLTVLEVASDTLTKDDVFTLSNVLQQNSTLGFLCLTQKVTNTVDERIVPCDWHATACFDQHIEFYGIQMMKPIQRTASISFCHRAHTIHNTVANN